MTLSLYEVVVPISTASGASGVHIFAGPAESGHAALQAAFEVYEQTAAGLPRETAVQGSLRVGWSARGYRPGWELDWRAATAAFWDDPYS